MQGDSGEIWNRPASVWVNDDAGWQCSASRYLNVGQTNYVAPPALCDKSQTLSAREGTITSDKAAASALELREYHPNTDCQWTLPVLPDGSKVDCLPFHALLKVLLQFLQLLLIAIHTAMHVVRLTLCDCCCVSMLHWQTIMSAYWITTSR